MSQLNYMDELIVTGIKKAPSRDYKCPCGKNYLSYAALFTHIKQKHQGKAPGQIQKPKHQAKPRGRPPLSASSKVSMMEKDGDNTRDTFNCVKPVEENNKNRVYLNGFSQIFTHLKQLYQPQQISLKIWQQVNSFKKFEEFIDRSQQKKKFEYKGVNLGYGLSQFLKHVSLQTQPWRFQQVLILFMLLLQYAIDQSNSQSIIQQAPVQILIEYMNPFLNYHIDDFSQYLGIERLWIMNRNNIHNIFLCFYNWLKWKDYTNFCITLID